MKVTLLALTQMSTIFGSTDYATFQAAVPPPAGSPEGTLPAIVDIGISHNLLARTGINIDQLEELVGSEVETFDYKDSRTEQILNVETRIQDLVDGIGKPTIALIGAVSGRIIKSQAFINSSKDFAATVAAKTRLEKEEKNRQRQIALSQERARARTLADTAVNTTVTATTEADFSGAAVDETVKEVSEVLAEAETEADFGGAPAPTSRRNR